MSIKDIRIIDKISKEFEKRTSHAEYDWLKRSAIDIRRIMILEYPEMRLPDHIKIGAIRRQRNLR